jgi:hypothetical protein
MRGAGVTEAENMTIADLLRLAQARLSHLNGQRADAAAIGNAAAIERLDREIAETQATIDALHTLG